MKYSTAIACNTALFYCYHHCHGCCHKNGLTCFCALFEAISPGSSTGPGKHRGQELRDLDPSLVSHSTDTTNPEPHFFPCGWESKRPSPHGGVRKTALASATSLSPQGLCCLGAFLLSCKGLSRVGIITGLRRQQETTTLLFSAGQPPSSSWCPLSGCQGSRS